MEDPNLSTDTNFHFNCLPDQRIKLNVGGKLFETTLSTIRRAGPDSLLSALACRSTTGNTNPIFIDRDPEIFSVLLSLLRTNHLPSTHSRFSKQELLQESLYYGLEALLKSAMSPPPLLGFDIKIAATIQPATDSFPTAFSPGSGDDGSLWIAHGGQISGYDWSLTLTGTVRTHLDVITSLHAVRSENLAVGSTETAGLHLYDFSSGRLSGSVNWTDPSDPRVYRASIHSLTSSQTSIFAAFDCWHKENCVACIDKSTLQIVSEISRQSGSSSRTMVAGKLKFLPEFQLLLGSSLSSGAFGHSGYIRLWDVRNMQVVWEVNEPGSGTTSRRFGDPFADLDVDEELGLIFKVCSKSGDLGMADLRKLGGNDNDSWIYLEDSNPSLRKCGNSLNSLICCHKKQVFCSREGGLEVWSQLPSKEGAGDGSENGDCEKAFRRNFVDKESSKGMIRKMEAAGERLFVSRDGFEGIEVWESSNTSERSLVS